MQKSFLFSIIAIIVILVVVLLSQQVNFKKVDTNIVSSAGNKAQANLSKASNLLNPNIISKITDEVKNRGEVINKEVDQQKNIATKSSENILEKTKNYFSGIANSIIKPGTPQNCPAIPK